MRQLILSDITRRLGHINNSEIFELTWLDIETLEISTTIVDTSYRNYTRSGWDKIVAENRLGLYDNLRITARTDRDQLPVISADSYPQLIEPLTAREIEQIIEHQQQQLQHQGLFEF